MQEVEHFFGLFRVWVPNCGWVLTGDFGFCMCIGLLWLSPSNDCDEFVFYFFLRFAFRFGQRSDELLFF